LEKEVKRMNEKEVQDLISSLTTEHEIRYPVPGEVWISPDFEEALVVLSAEVVGKNDETIPGIVYQIGKTMRVMSLDTFAKSFINKKDLK